MWGPGLQSRRVMTTASFDPPNRIESTTHLLAEAGERAERVLPGRQRTHRLLQLGPQQQQREHQHSQGAEQRPAVPDQGCCLFCWVGGWGFGKGRVRIDRGGSSGSMLLLTISNAPQCSRSHVLDRWWCDAAGPSLLPLLTLVARGV